MDGSKDPDQLSDPDRCQPKVPDNELTCNHGWRCLMIEQSYSMFPIKRTVFFTSVTVHKNTVRLIGNIE